jgi:hypothetical protein
MLKGSSGARSRGPSIGGGASRWDSPPRRSGGHSIYSMRGERRSSTGLQPVRRAADARLARMAPHRGLLVLERDGCLVTSALHSYPILWRSTLLGTTCPRPRRWPAADPAHETDRRPSGQCHCPGERRSVNEASGRRFGRENPRRGWRGQGRGNRESICDFKWSGGL